MKGEIGKVFYCSTGYMRIGGINGAGECCGARNNACEGCPARHRKHPTPSQYKEEYGEDVPDDMPVWYIDSDDPRDDWQPDLYANAVDDERYIIVIACTPFPKPDNTWRPE